MSQASPKNMEEEKPSAPSLNNSETNTGDYDATEARLIDLCKVFYLLFFYDFLVFIFLSYFK